MIEQKAVSSNTTSNTADGGQPPASFATPEQVFDQLRTVRATIPEAVSLSTAERRKLRSRLKLSHDVVQAQINVIGSADLIATAVGQPMEDVRNIADVTARWSRVEEELRGILASVEGANLVRRQQMEAISTRAAAIAVQLAADPKYATILAPQVQAIRRLKRLARRKKTAGQQPPAPTPAA